MPEVPNEIKVINQGYETVYAGKYCVCNERLNALITVINVGTRSKIFLF